MQFANVLFFFFVLTLVSNSALAQSKKELKEQNDELKRMYNVLTVEKANIEKEKKRLESERQQLAIKTKELNEAFRKKHEELKLSRKVLENNEVVIQEKSTEIMQKNASISSLQEDKKVSDLIAKQRELELVNKRASQKLLIMGIALIALISVLLLFMFIHRKKAGKILEMDKNKSDQLLLNILPHEIAEELKNTQKTQPTKIME